MICGFDFEERYGLLGKGFLHIHHLRPLHTIGEDYIVDYKKGFNPYVPELSHYDTSTSRLRNNDPGTVKRYYIES